MQYMTYGIAPGSIATLTWADLFLAIGASVILWHAYLAFMHPLADIPGPLLGRFSEFWKLQHMLQGDFSDSLGRLHRRHGKFVRIAPNEISILDVDAVQQIYGHGSHFVKSRVWYKAWSAPATNLFSERDPRQHAQMRKAVAHAYSNNSLLAFEPYIDAITNTLVEKLDEIADRGDTIDLAMWLHWYAFDVVGELALGKNFGLVETQSDPTGILAILQYSLQRTTIVGQLTGAATLLNTAFANRMLSVLTGVNGKAFRTWVTAQINTRMKQDDHRKDMLALFKQAKDANTGRQLDSLRILNESFTVIGAGSDTTSISLRAFFFYVLQAPACLIKLREEIDDAYDNGRLSHPVTYADASKLVYFQACLKESMRLQPAVGMHLPREVPAGGRSIGGRFFPPKSVVGISPKLLHRTSDAYGDDADAFEPERWIDGRRAAATRNFMTFGLGPRVCIGVSEQLTKVAQR